MRSKVERMDVESIDIGEPRRWIRAEPIPTTEPVREPSPEVAPVQEPVPA